MCKKYEIKIIYVSGFRLMHLLVSLQKAQKVTVLYLNLLLTIWGMSWELTHLLRYSNYIS